MWINTKGMEKDSPCYTGNKDEIAILIFNKTDFRKWDHQG